ncbi:MAG: hypothetical protein HC903_17390 [Methylacidiphilales bacterium]|nr:hypothetical protein [Candidatus Methylacidiphilales bacterium]NJR19588.1 hypothetical protein [Calothrix sp. CSU_2_0]
MTLTVEVCSNSVFVLVICITMIYDSMVNKEDDPSGGLYCDRIYFISVYDTFGEINY